jgi:hypothetical protein
MTIEQIKAMFVAGSRWSAVREDLRPLVIHGNTGTTTLPAQSAATTRIVEKVGSKDIVFILENQKRYWTPIPKAKSVIEARDGYLQFLIDDICKVTLHRL